jgi:ribosomal protein S18 acetylase RimI-like enzyme
VDGHDAFAQNSPMPSESDRPLGTPLRWWKGEFTITTDPAAATYAHLSDVYILEAYRGRGLSTWLMDTIMTHPDLQGLRRFSLTTRDADGLYRRYGFTDIAIPPTHLEINRRGLYVAGKTPASTGST